ncbi:hypothetical protein [Algoriphagus sp.]|uniref:hypothetical protein n=1 Tax=Algoriphagus sp. TaxID=1872435 RepID=UPI003F6EE3B7
MKTQTQPNYLFINEHDLAHHLHNSDPIIKINLYGEHLEESPYKPLYIKLLDRSKLKFNQLDHIIRSIIKAHANYALAFRCECLNFMNNGEGFFKNSSQMSMNY